MDFLPEFISWQAKWDSPNYLGIVFSDSQQIVGTDILGNWQNPIQFLTYTYKVRASLLEKGKWGPAKVRKEQEHYNPGG